MSEYDEWNSKCPNDYKNIHRWEHIGVVFHDGKVFEVYKCYQCKKGIEKELNLGDK